MLSIPTYYDQERDVPENTVPQNGDICKLFGKGISTTLPSLARKWIPFSQQCRPARMEDDLMFAIDL